MFTAVEMKEVTKMQDVSKTQEGSKTLKHILESFKKVPIHVKTTGNLRNRSRYMQTVAKSPNIKLLKDE